MLNNSNYFRNITINSMPIISGKVMNAADAIAQAKSSILILNQKIQNIEKLLSILEVLLVKYDKYNPLLDNGQIYISSFDDSNKIKVNPDYLHTFGNIPNAFEIYIIDDEYQIPIIINSAASPARFKANEIKSGSLKLQEVMSVEWINLPNYYEHESFIININEDDIKNLIQNEYSEIKIEELSWDIRWAYIEYPSIQKELIELAFSNIKNQENITLRDHPLDQAIKALMLFE